MEGIIEINGQKFDGMAEEEIFGFLEDLRQDGVTNMFGAVPYLMDEFPELERKTAKGWLFRWFDAKEEGRA